MDRTELSRMLAKALAYWACNKPTEARKHARLLIAGLIEVGILVPEDAR